MKLIMKRINNDFAKGLKLAMREMKKEGIEIKSEEDINDFAATHIRIREVKSEQSEK
jgi:hypothetical protein